MKAKNKINFKQSKYIIPAILFLPLVFLGYNILGMFNDPISVQPTVVENYEDIQAVPNAEIDDGDLVTRYDALMDDFGKQSDYGAIIDLDVEEQKKDTFETLYTEEELELLKELYQEKANDNIIENTYENKDLTFSDAIEIVTPTQSATTKEIPIQKSPNTNIDKPSNNNIDIVDDMSSDDPEMDRLLNILETMQESDRRNFVLDSLKEVRKNTWLEDQKRQAQLDSLLAPKKLNKIQGSHFNTITRNAIDSDTTSIKAFIDEDIKVVEGSRFRLRLGTDIEVNNTLIPKNSTLYAIVSGFSRQRVSASIESIVYNGVIYPLKLDIYDLDGMMGLYVPKSSFKEATNDATSQMFNNNMNFNDSGADQDLESFTFQTLQNIYTSTTQAIQKNIRQNKALLKYNSTILLKIQR